MQRLFAFLSPKVRLIESELPIFRLWPSYGWQVDYPPDLLPQLLGVNRMVFPQQSELLTAFGC